MAETKIIVDQVASQEVDWNQYLCQEEKIITDQPIVDVINASNRNHWCPVWYKKPLLSLMDMFSREVNLHRVPIIHDDGEVIGLVSQSLVVEFLYHHLPKALSERKLKNWLKQPKGLVHSVSMMDKAIEAFKYMLEYNVSGLAVVDEQGKLWASLSSSDIKGSLDTNLFADMYLPIYLYLQKCRPEFTKENADHPITCTLEDSIFDLLDKMVSQHIHRIFIVDKEFKPIQVISVCDIITILRMH